MKLFHSLIIILLVNSFIFPAFAGKKHCQKYRQKLDNIKSQQRQGNSLKRSNSLAKKEAKARDTWWRCETGKLKPKKRKKSKKSQKAKKSKKTKSKLTLLKTKNNATQPVIPFSTSKAIVVRSVKYEGKKLQAWLLFYQPEAQCKRPKSIQTFSLCVEKKREQQQLFEKSYIKE